MRIGLILLLLLACVAVFAQSGPTVATSNLNSSLMIGIVIAIVAFVVIFFLLRKDDTK
jgi:hypothetical protein